MPIMTVPPLTIDMEPNETYILSNTDYDERLALYNFSTPNFVVLKGDRFIIRLMTDLPKKYNCSTVHTEIENGNQLLGWVEDER